MSKGSLHAGGGIEVFFAGEPGAVPPSDAEVLGGVGLNREKESQRGDNEDGRRDELLQGRRRLPEWYTPRREKVMRWTPFLACLLFASSCKREIELIESSGENVVLRGESRRSITAPLSAELSFPLELPRNAELVLSAALLTERRIPRARVDFHVEISVDGRDVEVYRREVRAGEENGWHEARIDLGAWSGKSVNLTLSTGPSAGASPVPWATRVRTAWGDPRIRSRRTAPLGANERPSFVVLLVDTLRSDYLGAYGFEGAISPNLDRLAAESLLFENCFANAPWTKPSIATLFTSLPPAVHGVTGMGKATWSGEGGLTQVLPQDAETIAERFQGAGYRTAAFVANPFISPRYGFSQGFGVFERKEKTEALLASAGQWLAERASDREAPFFLYLHVMDVHGPYDAPRQTTRRSFARSTSESRTLTEESTSDSRVFRQTEWATEEERYRLKSWRAKYGAGVHAFDREIGAFLDDLRGSGVLDRAYLVLTSDHGEELMEHGGWNHGNNLYDHQLHVPLLIRKPLAEDAGRRIPSLVSLVDLMPTLSAVGGIEAPSGILGRDFSMLLRGGSDAEIKATFASAVNENPRIQGVRTLSHKLIWDEERGELELYDVVSDPKECRDLSEEDSPSVARLKTYLRENLERNQARGALAPEAVPVDDELRSRLKALGYVH
jgi:arylsulfatase A-like enzyme